MSSWLITITIITITTGGGITITTIIIAIGDELVLIEKQDLLEVLFF